MPEQAAAEKAKEAEAFTYKYKGCNGKYTDARGSGGSSKKNHGFCSSKCRAGGGCEKGPTEVPARAPEEQVQGLRYGPLQSRGPQGPVQGLRHGPLRARAQEGTVEALRHGPLRPRAQGEQVQGLRYGPLRARAPEGAVQGLPLMGYKSTQTQAAVEAAARRTTGFAVGVSVSAGWLRKSRPHGSASTGARRASARTAVRTTAITGAARQQTIDNRQ
jgi:hypothetical protein